jgi:hypothetical protein
VSWSVDVDFEKSMREAGELLADIATLPEAVLRQLPSSEILSLLECEIDFAVSPIGLILLESIRDGIEDEYGRMTWRALRTLHRPVPPDVWEAFWEDFASDDSLRHSTPSAVVAPALARGDQEFVDRFMRLYDGLRPQDVETRQNLRNSSSLTTLKVPASKH